MISEKCEAIGLNYCEVQADDKCSGFLFLAPAHKHKRIHYKSAEELAAYNEWICACTNCHNIIEDDRELTKDVFKRLRG